MRRKLNLPYFFNNCQPSLVLKCSYIKIRAPHLKNGFMGISEQSCKIYIITYFSLENVFQTVNVHPFLFSVFFEL